MAQYESTRHLETRDSTILKQAASSRKGRAHAHEHDSLMSREHFTPWGTPSADTPESQSPSVTSPVRHVTRSANHFQNDEAPSPAGDYHVPDVTPTHNHYQNNESSQKDERLKMNSSKINDAHIAFGETAQGDFEGTTSVLQPADSDRVRLKVAPGTSRINAGHDIFGEPIASPPPQSRVAEPFQDRARTGAIRTPWVGYTNADRK